MTDYARVDNLKEGDMVVTDDGFTCLAAFETFEVQKDERGLYIKCEEGHHYLDGQLDEGDVYIGLTKAE